MGRDTDRLNIISMNASGRKGRQFKDYRRSYLDEVIGGNEPDILFLPGDDPDMKTPILSEYRQAQVAHNNETVLLYDQRRLRLKTPTWTDIPNLVVPHVEMNKMMYPLMDILAPAPTQHVVKQFHCISWHWELTLTTSNELYKLAARYLMFAQFLAFSSGVEVLIGGDFNLEFTQIESLLQDHNNRVAQGIEEVKPDFEEMGLMDCMTEYINRPQRRLRQLKLHKCKTVANAINETDYFIASKEMQLCNTAFMTGSRFPTRCTTLNMNNCRTQPQTFCPTQTQMCIPSRPQRHNGG